MSHIYPNDYDSIKDKCSKACFLYILDRIDEYTLVDWLSTYKDQYHCSDFSLGPHIIDSIKVEIGHG